MCRSYARAAGRRKSAGSVVPHSASKGPSCPSRSSSPPAGGRSSTPPSSVLAAQGWRGLTHRAHRPGGRPARGLELGLLPLAQRPAGGDGRVRRVAARRRRRGPGRGAGRAARRPRPSPSPRPARPSGAGSTSPTCSRPGSSSPSRRRATTTSRRSCATRAEGLTTIVDDILARGGHAHSEAVSATIVAAVDGVLIAALLSASARSARASSPTASTCSSDRWSRAARPGDAHRAARATAPRRTTRVIGRIPPDA